MYQDKTKKLCLSGLFTAVIFVTTAYFFHIPVGANGGYLHFGDAFVYLAGSFLPAPYAMAAGAVGAGLSDALSPGGIIWLPATVVIKSLVALCFTSQCKTILCKRNYLALGGACIITLVGYYLAGVVLTGNAMAGLAEIPGSLLQSGGSALVYLLSGSVLDRADIKSKVGYKFGYLGEKEIT